MSDNSYVIGVDFGTDSVRAIVADARNGEVVGAETAYYPRWSEGKYCEPVQNQFRQHPQDYIDGLDASIRGALKHAGHTVAQNVCGLAVDTTGSTPCPVNESGVPLALLPEFADNPNAMFHLWKDHTAIQEASEINQLAATWSSVDYLKYQGRYSSEWFWAKILHASRIDCRVKEAAYAWAEHCDWIPALLTGRMCPQQMYHSACAAGHKALWHSEFGGLPERAFFAQLDPYLGCVRDHYGQPPQTADVCVGRLIPIWAERLGLSPEVIVGGSSFDAHAGAVGAGIAPDVLVKVIGTSTVDMLIAQPEQLHGKDVRTICGQAENSIMPGFVGIEAGQAAFGDVYAWFKNLLLWPLQQMLPAVAALTAEQKCLLIDEFASRLLPELAQQCEAQSSFESIQVIALDWLNGRRYPQGNESVAAAIAGLQIGVQAPQLYYALVLATACGARRIVESFLTAGLPIKQIIAVGGIAQKSPFVMQTLADVLNKPIAVSAATEACAKGAAMYAAVAAGLHTSLQEAQAAMGNVYQAVYAPRAPYVEPYQEFYRQYLRLGDVIEHQFT
ncbi:ribulokinase [Candidatus Moduliflexus flocculans]|uniref:Ribulokinase n=1 Tax=Candidatus Moduliflexus flocculans TaxID=1499966 RepID=A0A081BSV8_9BACT|nr:ribulokinase [Candidatus Moduliflexus flocculans]